MAIVMRNDLIVPRAIGALCLIWLGACGGEAVDTRTAATNDGGGGMASSVGVGGESTGTGGDGGGLAGEGCSEVLTNVGPQADYACTMVVGFSQTHNWYGGEDTPQFEASDAIAGDRWQLLWHPGAGVESWADASYSGWDTFAPLTRLTSTCATTFADVDRVVLTISSNEHDDMSPVEDWAASIQLGVAQVRAQVPSAVRIVLQPVVGSDELGCDVRAAKNHPLVVAAIAMVAADAQNPDVVAGATPTVATCDDFLDPKGHLGGAVASGVGHNLALCYGDR